MRFIDRADAGRQLAACLVRFSNRDDVTVLGLPRGGVPVAAEVSRAIDAPLDICVVRKLGAPWHPELAIGAIAENERVLSGDLIEELGLPAEQVEQISARERRELERQSRLYRRGRTACPVEGRTVVLVDDGIATGSTIEAAALSVRSRGAARIVIAAPVGAPESCRRLGRVADEVVCVQTPASFTAVALWYERFDQVGDDEVLQLLSLPTRAR